MICRKFYPAFRLKSVLGYVKEANQLICSTEPLVFHCCSAAKNEYSQIRLQPSMANFCTQELPKNSNIFGDISGRKFEHVEMSELEEKEEKFQDAEARVPRRLKPSIGQYGQMIKSHLTKKDIDSAIQVLDLVKENRDKPTMYMYNLLIRALAIQGNIKKCFSLYAQAKKRGLEPNAATYTALFNACAMSTNTKLALDHLNNLRQHLYEKQFLLNQTNYNAMVKAYGRHKQISEAFQLVDEMMDNHIPIGEITFNSLFHAAIADKENGLRHALTTWHLMYRWKVKHSLWTYNLLLRAMRDTKLGNVKINDVLLPGYESTRILLKEGERPDLLASPPFINTLLPLRQTEQSSDTQHSLVKANEQNLLAETASINLNDVLMSNCLLLFGGVEGLLNRMAAEDVTPDAKTITLLLDLIPNTVAAEDILLKIVDKKNIQLDIDFYNMLIKRRSMRLEYKAAKEVIKITERKSLSPNVMTFGVLALGCKEYQEGKEFLEGLEAFGYKPNIVIMGTLFKMACYNRNLGYVLYVMKYMIENRIKPNRRVIQTLIEFSKKIPELRNPKGKGKMRRLRNMEENIYMFEKTLSKWQQKNKEENL